MYLQKNYTEKKKTLIYIFTTIASIFLFFFITGCSGANSIASIQVENQSEESPITFVVGEFSFEDLNLIVKYENKEYLIKATPKGLLMIKKEY